MKQTKTVAGWHLAATILDLETRCCAILTMTRGDDNGNWVVTYDDLRPAPMPEEQPELLKQK